MHIKGDSVDQHSTIYWIYIIMVVIEQNLRFWISTGTYLPVYDTYLSQYTLQINNQPLILVYQPIEIIYGQWDHKE